MIVADSHCHLDFADFDHDREAVLERAATSGVGYITLIGTRLDQAQTVLDWCSHHEQLYAGLGVHPHYSGEGEAVTIADLLHIADHPKVVALGETGLDEHYRLSPTERQQDAFRQHIRAARILNLPLIIHTREAEQATMAILEAEYPPWNGEDPSRGVFHCFTGGETLARWAVDHGFYLSFSGILTFKTGEPLRRIAAQLPLDRILLETDAPYLAPLPYRGKRNEPSYLIKTLETLAQVRNLPVAEVAAATTANYRRLFRLPEPSATPSKGQLTYIIGDGLYLNITHGCTLHCDFCPKWVRPIVHQYDLTLTRQPTASELIAAMGDLSPYREVVFCGYGESTLRLPVLLTVAAAAKRQGKPVRLNTDGLANLVYRQDVTPRMRGLIDVVSVSLNAQDEATYQRYCHPRLEGSYAAMLSFARLAKAQGIQVVLTAIEGLPGVDISACKDIADALGVGFRARILDRVGQATEPVAKPRHRVSGEAPGEKKAQHIQHM